MSTSVTQSHSATFTRVHARYMAAKVAADLKRMQRFYGSPSDSEITSYETELVEWLVAGYLGEVTYGFRRDGRWIVPTVQYTATDLADGGADEDPGRIPPNADTSGSSFYSYLTYSVTWYLLPDEARERFRATLPFQRTGAPQPGINGYLSQDRTYSSGGRALIRSSVRSW